MLCGTIICISSIFNIYMYYFVNSLTRANYMLTFDCCSVGIYRFYMCFILVSSYMITQSKMTSLSGGYHYSTLTHYSLKNQYSTYWTYIFLYTSHFVSNPAPCTWRGRILVSSKKGYPNLTLTLTLTLNLAILTLYSM